MRDDAAIDRRDGVEMIPTPRDGERVDALAQLDRRVTRLERLAGGADVVTRDAGERHDLPVSDPRLAELTELAASAERAHALGELLASPSVRAGCERAISAWQEWRRAHRAAWEAAIGASRRIAITSADQRGFHEASREFAAARVRLAELERYRQQWHNRAKHAREQLAHDREVRERFQGEIEAGHRAWISLMARLRLHLATAVERDEPLPAWLVVLIGPPSADRSRWLKLATQLLAYRITYGIADPVRPLGEEPTADDSARRRRWHRTLRRRLAEWHRA